MEESARRSIEKVETEDLSDVAEVNSKLVFGSAAQEIARYAQENDIDLIVIATHGETGLTRLVTGSVAERVVRLAPCPVLSVPPVPDDG
jgi:nucleotide-binding universal stress UspA family protein